MRKFADVKYEPVEICKLKWLLDQLRKEGDLEWYKRVKEYQRKVSMRKAEVTYEYKDYLARTQQGRVYASNGRGLQMFRKEIRNYLACEWGWDIDMVNAHPVIIYQTAKKNKWYSPCLKRVVEDREDVLSWLQSAYNVDRATAKMSILRQIYLGSFSKWEQEQKHDDATLEIEIEATNNKEAKEFMDNLQDELLNIAACISNMNSDLLKLVKHNKPGASERTIKSSVMSIYAQTEENKILAALEEALAMKKRSLVVKIYDGGIVLKHDGETEFPRDVLHACEKYITKTTQYDIKLEVKPMESRYSSIAPSLKSGKGMEYIDYHTAYALMKDGAMEYGDMKDLFERFNFKVNNPSCFINVDDAKVSLRSSEDMYQAHKHMECIDEDGTDIKFMKKWSEDPAIKEYHTFDFLPPPLNVSGTTFNTFPGFAADKQTVTEGIKGCPEKFIKHLSILVNHDADSIRYLTSVFAQMIQEPGKLPGIAVVFISSEGAGKNIMMNFMADIIGRDMYYETADPEKDIFGRFSMGRANKLMLNLDETSKKTTYAYAEILKNMITSEYINFEQKNVNPKVLRNCCRIFITSNNEVPVFTDDKGRRYVIFRCSDELIGSSAYFNDFVEYQSKVENIKAVLEYLRSYDYSGINWIKDRPVTEQAKSIMGENSHYTLRWMEKLAINLINKGHRI